LLGSASRGKRKLPACLGERLASKWDADEQSYKCQIEFIDTDNLPTKFTFQK
jgi:hypothetical protein